MENFTDFTIAASQNETLGTEAILYMETATPATLSQWFSSRGFTVSSQECMSLLKNGKGTVKEGPAPRY